jgi:hypothetical protein
MSVSCEYCVLSSKAVCDAPIPRPEQSYRLSCVIVCDLETSVIRRPWPALGCRARGGEKNNIRTTLICDGIEARNAGLRHVTHM